MKYYHLFMTMPVKRKFRITICPRGLFKLATRGDRDTWIEIEKSAKERTFEEGMDAWQRYYGKHEDVLPDRMFFIADPERQEGCDRNGVFR